MKLSPSAVARMGQNEYRSYKRIGVIIIFGVLAMFATPYLANAETLLSNHAQRMTLHLLRHNVFPPLNGVGIRSVVNCLEQPNLVLRGGSEEMGLSLRSHATAEFTQIMTALMSPDNAARTEAESRYEVLKKESPESASVGLLTLLTSTEAEDKRAFAAVIASRTLPTVWPQLSIKTRDAMKHRLLLLLQSESVPHIGRKVANVISTLSADCREGTWPNLLPSIFALGSAKEASKRELALYTLGLLPQQLYHEMKKEIVQLKNIYSSALTDPDCKIQMAAMRASVSYLQTCDSSKEMRGLQSLLPLMLNSIGSALQQDEEAARAGLEALVEITDLDTKFFKPHLPQIVAAMQQHVAMNEKLEASTRELGLEILLSLSERAPAMMKKLDSFVPQVVAVCMAMMVQGLPVSNECETWTKWEEVQDDEEEDESAGCFSAARNGLDRLAMALGGGQMVPACFRYIPDFLGKADDWRYRMVGLIGISQTGEGSYKEMKKHLQEVLDLVVPRLTDEHPRVRWAAVNCIGQMCSDFGPVIQTAHHQTLVPAIVARLDPASEACLRVRGHAAAALINFCEHAEAAVLDPHLESILFNMAGLMQNPHRRAREQAVTSTATIAVTVSDKFDPFYASFMPFLKSLLASITAPEERRLRGKVLECISLIGGAVGRDRFRADARETMELLVRTQQEPLEADDPQIAYIHTACGRICRCLGAEFVPYLPAVLPALLRSASIKAEVNLEEEEVDEKTWDDIETRDVGDQTVGVRTSALDEKQTACEMVITYLNELRGAFFPFLESTAKVMVPLLTYSVHEDIRSCAADAVPALCRCAAAHVKEGGGDPAIVQQALDFLYPAVQAALSSEQEQTVQGHLARAIGQMVDACRPAAVPPVQLQETAATLKLLLDEAGERVESVVEGRDDAEDEEDGDDGDESRTARDEEALEMEEELIEQIAYAVGKLILTQGEAFVQHADTLLPWFLDKLSPSAPARLQRLSMAMVDDVIEFAGPLASRYVPSLLPLMMTHSLSPDIELRQAALFGIGLCAEHGGAAFRPMLAEAQLRLETAIQEPDARSTEKESATDNAAAALGKLALHHGDALAEADRRRAWAAWLEYLPLRADVGEAGLVHKQLCRLVHSNHPDVLGPSHANLPRVLRILGEVLETDLLDVEGHTEARQILLQAVTGLGRPALESMLVGVPKDAADRIRRGIEAPALAAPVGAAARVAGQA